MIRFTYTLPTILVQLNYTAATAQLMTIPMWVTYLTSPHEVDADNQLRRSLCSHLCYRSPF